MDSLISIDSKLKRIGLLGGSFNPPHAGHLAISKEAIKRLNLDLVIWLVSPQNPLKELDIKSTLDSRMEASKKLVQDNDKILVSDLERGLGSNYTVDTIKYLKNNFADKEFVWLMGADNVVSFHKWRSWQEIIDSVTIGIFDRNDHISEIQGSEINKYSKIKVVEKVFEELKPNVCYYFTIKKIDISSTQIRNQGKIHG